jgi:hypothetical protein
MTPEEIKAKSAEIAALYTAKANGKTLQIQTSEGDWIDTSPSHGPDMMSDLSKYRVKPEPRRMWETFSLIEAKDVGIAPCCATHTEAEADEWRVKGYKVTEWVEVLP